MTTPHIERLVETTVSKVEHIVSNPSEYNVDECVKDVIRTALTELKAETIKGERERMLKFVLEKGNETQPTDIVSTRHFYFLLKEFLTQGDKEETSV